MSRIGKAPIAIPNGVTVEKQDDTVVVKGPKGELSEPIVSKLVTVTINDKDILVERKDDEKPSRSFHGLQRTLIANMVQGVSEGFKKELELHGVGYRASVNGNVLKLGVGYSHDIDFKLPEGIQVEVNNTDITVSGISKQMVGQVAAKIRAVRKPEPYKGKGIRYKDEYIIRKAGKAASA